MEFLFWRKKDLEFMGILKKRGFRIYGNFGKKGKKRI